MVLFSFFRLRLKNPAQNAEPGKYQCYVPKVARWGQGGFLPTLDIHEKERIETLGRLCEGMVTHTGPLFAPGELNNRPNRYIRGKLQELGERSLLLPAEF